LLVTFENRRVFFSVVAGCQFIILQEVILKMFIYWK
jgi:hypothetical protein